MKKAVLHIFGLAAIAALLCVTCGDNGLDRSSDNNGDVDGFLNRINGIPDTTKTPDTTRGGTDEPSLVLAEGEAWVHLDSGLIFKSDNRLITIFKHDSIWLYGDTGNYNTNGNIINIGPSYGIYSISSDTLTFNGLYTTHPFTRTGGINPKTRYYLTISNNPGSGGSVSKNPDKEFYFFDEQVAVTASADTAAAYGFAKWTGASTETTPAITVTMNGNKTLTAGFELITYAITFNAAGGDVTPTSDTTGMYWKLDSLPTPTRTGYIFIGWYTAATGGTQVTTTAFRGNTALYAQWEGATFTDSRDSTSYRWVQIGTQTWMAENLNYDVPGNITDVCYSNDTANCTKYGRLYNWSTAMGLDASYNNTIWDGSDVKHQGVCPDGWHLPSNAEWFTLTGFVGDAAATKLQSSTGWNHVTGTPYGTDEYGFSALPGGYVMNVTGGAFSGVGDRGYWWSATEADAGNASYRFMMTSTIGGNGNSKGTKCSVRCVKN